MRKPIVDKVTKLAVNPRCAGNSNAESIAEVIKNGSKEFVVVILLVFAEMFLI